MLELLQGGINMYGAFFESESGFKLFLNGYRMLKFIGAGYTPQYNGFICALRFPCPTFPIVFIRAGAINTMVAVHSIVNNGDGSYTLYTIGAAEVFVFSEQPSRSQYGLEIYDEQGNVTFNSSDQPVKPVAYLNFPPMQKDDSYVWNSGLGARKLAFCLNGNRGHWEVDIQTWRQNVWRDIVQGISGGFILRSYQLASNEPIDDNGIDFSAFPRVDQAWVSMTVIDVHDLNFAGRRSDSFY